MFLHTTEVIEVTQEITNTGIIPLEALRAHLSKRPHKDDDPSQFIVIDDNTDASSDVDDLSEVSMASAGGIGKQEFQGLYSDIAAQHQ